MKYRLKDRELQKKLDEISNGDFSRQVELNNSRLGPELEFKKQIVLWFGSVPLYALEITPDMLEEVREYDPHKWNNFPEVEPPEDVWMRVERCVDGRTYHFAARYVPVGDSEDYEWLSEANLSIDVDRFRQWDDPEDEEDDEE